MSGFFLLDKVVKLVNGGSVINRAYPSSSFLDWTTNRAKEDANMQLHNFHMSLKYTLGTPEVFFIKDYGRQQRIMRYEL